MGPERNPNITSVLDVVLFRDRMSLQWTAVAAFLYGEVFLVLLLCIPFISAKRYKHTQTRTHKRTNKRTHNAAVKSNDSLKIR